MPNYELKLGHLLETVRNRNPFVLRRGRSWVEGCNIMNALDEIRISVHKLFH